MKKLLLSLLVATGLALPIHAAEVTDVLNASTLNLGTSYTTLTNKSITSGATYSGSMTKSTVATTKDYPQAKKQTTFLYVTAPAKDSYIKSVTITSPSGDINLVAGNASNSDISKVTATTVINSANTTWTPTEKYEYISLYASASRTMKEISIVWTSEEGGEVPPTPEVIAKPEISPADGSTLYPGDNVTISCATADAKIFYTINKGEEIEYTAPIEFETDGTYVIEAYATDADKTDMSEVASATFTYSSERPAEPETLTDELVIGNFSKVTTNQYTDDSYTSTITGVTYTAKIAKGNNAIQMNATSGNGIVTTANPNGYVVKSVTIELNSNTSNSNRTITAYSNASGNFSSIASVKDGTSIGALKKSDSSLSATFTPETRYTSVGFGANGALYVDKITIVWEKAEADTREEAGLAFANAEVAYDLNDEFTAQTLTNPNGLAVKWTSSNTSVATIDAETGAIDVLAIGSTTIRATFDGNDNYLPAEVSYTLTVSDRTILVHTFDFINNDYGMIRHTSGTDYNPTPYSFGDGWVTVNANGQNRLWSTKGLRLYKNATITVYATECDNATIVSARFLNADGSVDTNRNHQFTIEGNKATFTLSASDNADFPKIEICYKDITEEEIIAAFEASEKFTVKANSNVIANGSSVHKDETADVIVSIAHHYPHATIYYKWEADPEESAKEEEEESEIETYALEGYKAHTEDLKLPSAGTLSYYAELNGKQTPVQQITVTGTTTSISEVNVAEGGADEWFDLQGRRVAKAVNGVFIHRVGGKAVKVRM